MTSDDTAAPGLIPAPREVTWAGPEQGRYPLDEATVLSAAPGTEGVARWLRATVGAATGLPLADGTEGSRVELSLDPALAPEAYGLVVDGDAVRITGGSAAGLFWGRRLSVSSSARTPSAARPAPRGAPGTSRRWSSRTRRASPGAA